MVAVQAIGVGSQQRTLLWQAGQAVFRGERSFADAMNKGTVEPQAVIRSWPTFV
jgi:hypothetical protein